MELGMEKIDRRKFNKPIRLKILYWDNSVSNCRLVTLERLEKKIPNFFQETTREIKKIILRYPVSRSSYYRVLRWVGGKKALIEGPSFYI